MITKLAHDPVVWFAGVLSTYCTLWVVVLRAERSLGIGTHAYRPKPWSGLGTQSECALSSEPRAGKDVVDTRQGVFDRVSGLSEPMESFSPSK